MKITKRILAVILALTLTIGGISAAAQAAQTNRLFTANVFILVDNAWVAQDRAEAINGAEARALQTLFDRFFSNDLVGVHIAQSTNRVAIRPLEGVNLSAVLYNAQANTFRTMVLNRVCANGFWIFDIPQGAELPYSIVVSNGVLTLRTASISLPTQATTTRTTDRGGRDNDRDSGGSGNNWTPPQTQTPPPGGGNQPPTPPAFVAVTSIIGVPTAATVGTPLTLAGTVVPANATNQTITWSLGSGSTAAGASVTGGQASATGAGTVVVTATITDGIAVGTDFTADFTINFAATYTVTMTDDGNGTASTDHTTATAGTTVTITATPASADYQFLQWVVVSGGVTLSSATTIPATFTMPANNVEIEAEFELTSLGITNLLANEVASLVNGNPHNVPQPGSGVVQVVTGLQLPNGVLLETNVAAASSPSGIPAVLMDLLIGNLQMNVVTGGLGSPPVGDYVFNGVQLRHVASGELSAPFDITVNIS